MSRVTMRPWSQLIPGFSTNRPSCSSHAPSTPDRTNPRYAASLIRCATAIGTSWLRRFAHQSTRLRVQGQGRRDGSSDDGVRTSLDLDLTHCSGSPAPLLDVSTQAPCGSAPSAAAAARR